MRAERGAFICCFFFNIVLKPLTYIGYSRVGLYPFIVFFIFYAHYFCERKVSMSFTHPTALRNTTQQGER